VSFKDLAAQLEDEVTDADADKKLASCDSCDTVVYRGK
jgi:hypothetical protein